MPKPEKFKNKYRNDPSRWQFWDYSAPGSYFITICIQNRECLLGTIVNGKMHYSKYGEIVKNEFLKIPEYHQRIMPDAWIVMPNHIHCIITLGNDDFNNGVSVVNAASVGEIHEFPLQRIHEFSLQIPSTCMQQQQSPTINDIKQYRKQRRKMIIPKIIGKFKMQTSKQINLIRNTPGQKNWQSDYHDHVIRDNDSYQHIKTYIQTNPQNWNGDKFNL